MAKTIKLSSATLLGSLNGMEVLGLKGTALSRIPSQKFYVAESIAGNLDDMTTPGIFYATSLKVSGLPGQISNGIIEVLQFSAVEWIQRITVTSGGTGLNAGDIVIRRKLYNQPGWTNFFVYKPVSTISTASETDAE